MTVRRVWPYFIELALVVALLWLLSTSFQRAFGATVTVCQSSPGSTYRQHWAYRFIDGRQCWFPGENGRSKKLLRWDTDSSAPAAPSPDAIGQPRIDAQIVDPGAAPQQQEEVTEAEPALTEDVLLAYSCCWPDLALEAQAVGLGNQPMTFDRLPMPIQSPAPGVALGHPTGRDLYRMVARRSGCKPHAEGRANHEEH